MINEYDAYIASLMIHIYIIIIIYNDDIYIIYMYV